MKGGGGGREREREKEREREREREKIKKGNERRTELEGRKVRKVGKVK